MSQMRTENSAKAVILDADGYLLLIRYQDTSDMGLGTWYALPGGRQHAGETLTEALERECLEELGARVRPGRLLFVREYLHTRHELAGTGRDQHKVEFMFSCALATEPAAAHAADTDQAAAEWVAPGKLGDLNIFPRRLRELPALLDTPDTPVYWGDQY